MSKTEFSVTGKWILCGEHAVLRGVPAVVFPLKTSSNEFSFAAHFNDFQVNVSGILSDEIQLLLLGLFEKACLFLGINKNLLKGHLYLNSQLPLGAGLGASATLCVGVSQVLVLLGLLPEDKKYDFSKNLENIFHGESSGIDVAIAIHQKPILFQKGNELVFLNTQFYPKLYISYCGEQGFTKTCVEQVKNYLIAAPLEAQKVDELMRSSVELCLKAFNCSALSGFNEVQKDLNDKEKIILLRDGMLIAKSCFEKWGLISVKMTEHMNLLMSAGALAVKPTGSGKGGYILSLWNEEPPSSIKPVLTSCF